MANRVRADAAQTEADRTMTADVLRELGEIGLFEMLRPAGTVGPQRDPLVHFADIRAISAACPSTGWAAALLGVASWHVAMLGSSVCDEVWGSAPNALVTASYAPAGRLESTGGGYVLSGEWPYVPAAELSSWVCLCALTIDGSGAAADVAMVAVPISDCVVGRHGNTTGLLGAGARRVAVRDVFVPAHRVRLAGRPDPLLDEPGLASVYRVPFTILYSMAACMPVLGAVQGAFDYHLTRASERAALSYGGKGSAENQFAQVAVARGLAELDASVLQLERDLREAIACAKAGTPIPVEVRLRARRDQVRATERSVEAMDVLMKASAGHGVRHGGVIERAWRDVHTAAAHMVNNAEPALRMYGRWAYGQEVGDDMVML
ncbi:flavin-dependent monooxygenase [Nocardia sp. NPDC059091]|uniref:flavin-dependent monooxygenase n=1 Tax=unclassified Nocardia TaxID=2637762 RepID=UPI00369485EF